jgi:hypothetical protein
VRLYLANSYNKKNIPCCVWRNPKQTPVGGWAPSLICRRPRAGSALRGITHTGEKDKNWRTVRMTDMNGSETDVRVSDNFEQLSPREQAQRVDEFIGLVRSPTDKFFTYTFGAMLIAPPVAAGILLFLIAWGLSGFRARAST